MIPLTFPISTLTPKPETLNTKPEDLEQVQLGHDADGRARRVLRRAWSAPGSSRRVKSLGMRVQDLGFRV